MVREGARGKKRANERVSERAHEERRGRKKGQRTTGRGRSQSCAHFFSWPNPKTLLCPPKINYPPYSKNETGREQRNAARYSAVLALTLTISLPRRPIAVHLRPIQREVSQGGQEEILDA